MWHLLALVYDRLLNTVSTAIGLVVFVLYLIDRRRAYGTGGRIARPRNAPTSPRQSPPYRTVPPPQNRAATLAPAVPPVTPRLGPGRPRQTIVLGGHRGDPLTAGGHPMPTVPDRWRVASRSLFGGTMPRRIALLLYPVGLVCGMFYGVLSMQSVFGLLGATAVMSLGIATFLGLVVTALPVVVCSFDLMNAGSPIRRRSSAVAVACGAGLAAVGSLWYGAMGRPFALPIRLADLEFPWWPGIVSVAFALTVSWGTLLLGRAIRVLS